MTKLTFLTAILIATSTFAQIPSYIPSNGLIGYWPLNGNANDISGNGNNGSAQGNFSYESDRFGNQNSVIKFNSTSDIVCTQTQFVNPINFTISIWIKSNANSLGEQLVGLNSSQCANGGAFDRILSISETQLNYYTYTNNAPSNINGNGVFKDNNWHQIVITLGSTGRKIYVDGQLFMSDGVTSSANYSGYWRLGGNYLTNSSLSSYDEFTLWNRILTATEVSNLYSNSYNLPVELTSFHANCSENTTNINWQTASEHNSDYFELLKSRDGNSWTSENITLAAGNSSSLINYIYTDNNDATIVYYKLKQVDKDGQHKEYGPISSDCNDNFKHLIFPNPTTDEFTITRLELYNQISTIHITDVNGKLVKELEPTTSKFTLGSANPGVYFLTISASNKHEVIKLVKE